MIDGYIRLHRKILDSGLMNNPKLFTFWMWCLLKASYKKHKVIIGYQDITLQPGQFIFGRHQAAVETHLSERCVRTCLTALKTTNRMTIESTSKYSIVTICNWEYYQSNEIENDQQNDQQSDKQTTNKRPASDHKQESKEGKEYTKRARAQGGEIIMSKNERDRLREEIEEKDKKENEVREAYREALCKKNKAINDRFREKVIMPLKEELLPNSWECFINGLVVQSYKNKTITLFHPDRAEWVIEYYLERIKELMPGITVNITSEMK